MITGLIEVLELAGALSLTVTGSVLLALASCGSGPTTRRRRVSDRL